MAANTRSAVHRPKCEALGLVHPGKPLVTHARPVAPQEHGESLVPEPRLVANSNGFSLHAGTRVKAGDCKAREKLYRYVNRPALCLKRLEVRSDGQISWSLRNPWRDGTKAFVMTPYEFLARRAAIVPHPREHQLTYQGVLAPASPLRDSVVPRSVKGREPNTGKRIGMKSSQCPAKRSSGQNYIPRAELLRRVLESVRDGLRRKKPPPPETGIPMPARQGRLGFEK